jgi:MFS family permease
MWSLIIGAAVSAVGISFLWPLTAIYVHRILGQPMPVVGLVMMVSSAATLFGSLAGGLLYDARGARGPLLASMAVAAAVLLILGFDRDFWVYAGGVTLEGFAMGISMPIFNAMAAEVWPEGGRTAFNAVYVAQNAGVAVGSSLGGLLATIGFQFCFYAAGLFMVGFCLLIYFTYRGDHWVKPPHKHAGEHRASAGVPIWQVVGWPTLILSASMALDWLAYDQWEVTVPNFMQAQGFILPLYSVLWTVNTVLILAAQPLLSRFVAWLPRLTTQLLVGSGLFLGAFSILAFFHAYPAYLSAMVLATLGEMLVLPAVPAAAEARSRPERRGLVQGVVGMAGALGRMAGPLIGGLLFVASDPRELFLVMLGFFLVGGLGYIWADRLGNGFIVEEVGPEISAGEA